MRYIGLFLTGVLVGMFFNAWNHSRAVRVLDRCTALDAWHAQND